MMKVFLAGRAAEQVVFGRVTNGAANDLEKATGLARSMVFEYGMGESVSSRTMRADNYALSEETKRLRDAEQARLTDEAFRGGDPPDHEAPLQPRPACRSAAREGDARQGRARRAARGPRARVTCGRDGRHRPRAALGARYHRPACGASTTSASRWPTSTRRSRATSGCSAPSSRAVRPHDEQGVEAASLRVGAGHVELLAALGPDTPVGRFLARRGPGMHHVAYEVEDLPERARPGSRAQGAQLIDTAPRHGAVRDAGRLRPPRRRPRRTLGAGGAWLSGFESRSASTAARSSARSSRRRRPTVWSRRLRRARTASLRARRRGRPLHGRAAANRLRQALRARGPGRLRRLGRAPAVRSAARRASARGWRWTWSSEDA